MILGNGNPSLYTAHGPARRSRPEVPAEPPQSREHGIDELIQRHPAAAVAAALAVGVTLGWFLKRK